MYCGTITTGTAVILEVCSMSRVCGKKMKNGGEDENSESYRKKENLHTRPEYNALI
jgi:hypothetical protein